MILNCQNCNTNYLVPSNSIGVNGRNVKCTKCNNIWFQTPISIDNVTKQIDDNSIIPDIVQHNVPAVVKNNKYIWMICSSSFLFIINIISIIILYSDLLDDKINIKKMINFNNFSITDAEIELNENGGRKLIYKVKNHSNYNKLIPVIRLNYLDSNKSSIKSSVIEDHDIIQSNEVVTRSISIDSIESGFLTLSIY